MFRTLIWFGLLCFSTALHAQAIWVETPALRIAWHDNPSSTVTLADQIEVYEQTANQRNDDAPLWFYVPANQRFIVEKSAVSEHWQVGQTATLLLSLSGSDWQCNTERCALPEQSVNRIVKMTVNENQDLPFDAYLGAWQKHSTTIWQTQKTALPAFWLTLKENRDLYYVLSPEQPLTLYFDEGTYVKTQLRQYETLSTNAKAQLFINDAAVAWVKPSTTRALEYEKQAVGLLTEEYLSVCQQCYLKVMVNQPTLIRILTAKRPLLDMDVDEELALNQFLPHWYTQLDALSEQILVQKKLDAFVDSSTIAGNTLALKRRAELNQALTKQHVLVPTHISEQINTVTQHAGLQRGLRLITPYLISNPTTTLLTRFEVLSTMRFNLQHLNRVDKNVKLRLKSQHAGTLRLHDEEQTRTVHFLPSADFQELTFTVNEVTTLTLDSSTPVELSLSVDVLSDVPSHVGWFHYAHSQQYIPSAIALLFKTQMQLWQTQYRKSLTQFRTPWSAQRDSHSSDIATEYYKLGEVQQRFSQGETSALFEMLEKLTNSPFPEVQSQAWSIQLRILEQLGYAGLAKQYYEALLLQNANSALNIQASTWLSERYRDEQNTIAMRGLCSLQLAAQPDCNKHIAAPALANQQWLWLAWYELFSGLKPHSNPSYSAEKLDWTLDSPEQTPPQYTIKHGDTDSVLSETGRDDYYLISPSRPLQIDAKSQMQVMIRARAPKQSDSEPSLVTKWLFIQSKQDTFLPVFPDIVTETLKARADVSLSIAATSRQTLDNQDRLILTSDAPLYVSLRFYPRDAQIETQLNETQDSLFLPFDVFQQQLHQGQLSAQTLLNNSLFYLEQRQLQQDDYIATLLQADILKLQKDKETRLAKLYSYGQWQSLRDYTNFEGNQLIDLRAKRSFSTYETVLRSATGNRNAGLPLKASQTLEFDVSQLNVPAIRLQFAYQAAAISYASQTHVLVTTDTVTTPVTLNLGSDNVHGIALNKLTNPIVKVRWSTPNLAELIYVIIQVPTPNGQWKDFALDDKQRFYLGSESLPISFTLKANSLIKLETVQHSHRAEKLGFYPAGKVILPFEKPTLTRAYLYALTQSSQPLQYRAAPYAFLPPSKLPDATPEPLDMNIDHHRLHQDDWYQFAQFELNQQSLYELEDNLSERVNRILSLGVKRNVGNQWVGLGAKYVMEQQFHSYWQASAKYAWQSSTSNWFAYGRWQGLYQPNTTQYDSAWRNELALEAGQRFDIDNQWQLRWSLQGFTNTSNVNAQDDLRDPLISPDIYTAYRDAHRRGLQLELAASYQAFSDQRWVTRLVNRTNDNGYSPEQSYFSWGIQQFYQGQIWQAGVYHRLRHSDEDRLKSRWDHQLDLAWLYPFSVSDEFAGHLSLQWRHSLNAGNYALSLAVRFGNEVNTGFTPFAPDEVLFESLRLSHLLSYSEDDNE